MSTKEIIPVAKEGYLPEGTDVLAHPIIAPVYERFVETLNEKQLLKDGYTELSKHIAVKEGEQEKVAEFAWVSLQRPLFTYLLHSVRDESDSQKKAGSIRNGVRASWEQALGKTLKFKTSWLTGSQQKEILARVFPEYFPLEEGYVEEIGELLETIANEEQASAETSKFFDYMRGCGRTITRLGYAVRGGALTYDEFYRRKEQGIKHDHQLGSQELQQMRHVNREEFMARQRSQENRELYLSQLKGWTDEMGSALKKETLLDPTASPLIEGYSNTSVVTSDLFTGILENAQTDIKIDDPGLIWDGVKEYSIFTRALMQRKDVNHFHMNIDRFVAQYVSEKGYQGKTGEEFGRILRKTLYAMDVISPATVIYFDMYYNHGRDVTEFAKVDSIDVIDEETGEVTQKTHSAQTAFIPDFPLWFTYYCRNWSREMQQVPDPWSKEQLRLLDLTDPVISTKDEGETKQVGRQATLFTREAGYQIDKAGWFIPSPKSAKFNTMNMVSRVDTQLKNLRYERLRRFDIMPLFDHKKTKLNF